MLTYINTPNSSEVDWKWTSDESNGNQTFREKHFTLRKV